jgi:hypothetical protein
MKFILLFTLFLSQLVYAAKDLPQDIKLEKGSLLILKQYLEKQSEADLSFPVLVQLTCKPKLKNSKLETHHCQLSDVKFAQK